MSGFRALSKKKKSFRLVRPGKTYFYSLLICLQKSFSFSAGNKNILFRTFERAFERTLENSITKYVEKINVLILLVRIFQTAIKFRRTEN